MSTAATDVRSPRPTKGGDHGLEARTLPKPFGPIDDRKLPCLVRGVAASAMGHPLFSRMDA